MCYVHGSRDNESIEWTSFLPVRNDMFWLRNERNYVVNVVLGCSLTQKKNPYKRPFAFLVE
jgi:hypothetical protein